MFITDVPTRSIRALGASLLLAVAVLLLAQPSHASPMVLVETWQRTDIGGEDWTAQTVGFFDPAGIMGMGAERAYVTQLSLLLRLNGVNQVFAFADIPNPLVFAEEKDPYVDFQNGERIGVRQVDLGGNPLLLLLDTGGRGLGMSATTLLHTIPPSTDWHFDRVTSEVSAVAPEPGTLALLATGWIAVFVARRRAGIAR